MADQSASVQDQVATLNEHLAEFSDFAIRNGYSDEFAPIHFVGTPDPHKGEAALLDHWDEFLQYSQEVLNADEMPRDDALGHIDAINLDYKRTLSKIQALS